jgi:hypothetical protein
MVTITSVTDMGIRMVLNCRDSRNYLDITHVNFQKFVPDTAVRWLGPVAFTAAPRSALNARRSPAGSGRRCVLAMNTAHIFDGKPATARMPSHIHVHAGTTHVAASASWWSAI